ncbi:MAG: hypothetical protein QQN63_08935, partial [Nitrosopumilus sp.]
LLSFSTSNTRHGPAGRPESTALCLCRAFSPYEPRSCALREILAAEVPFRLGVGIPPITRLHMALKNGGIEMGQISITPKEFMQNNREKLHD